MEFPTLGKRCSFATCRQLDFLPFKCGACEHIFCLEHRTAEAHSCQAPAFIEDRRVPTCPLCQKPVSVAEGEDVNTKINEHIDGGCKAAHVEAKKSKRCTAKRCRTSELFPVQCNKCRRQFCLKHRHPQDHECAASKQTPNKGTTIVRIPESALQRYERTVPLKSVSVKG